MTSVANKKLINVLNNKRDIFVVYFNFDRRDEIEPFGFGVCGNVIQNLQLLEFIVSYRYKDGKLEISRQRVLFSFDDIRSDRVRIKLYASMLNHDENYYILGTTRVLRGKYLGTVLDERAVIIDKFRITQQIERANDRVRVVDFLTQLPRTLYSNEYFAIMEDLPLYKQIDFSAENLRTCNDLAMIEEVELAELMRNDRNKAFCMVLGNGEIDSVCYDEEFINSVIDDGNLLYECKGELIAPENIDRRVGNINLRNDLSFVKLPLSNFNVYVYKDQFESAILSPVRVFFVVPWIDSDSGEQLEFSHTISRRNLSTNPDYIGSNHCQQGSSIKVYRLAMAISVPDEFLFKLTR